jgi:hypothetical protein
LACLESGDDCGHLQGYNLLFDNLPQCFLLDIEVRECIFIAIA